LSGEIGDPDLRTDNSYHVVRGLGLNNSTLVDGFTITQGHSYGEFTPSTLDGFGAGMLLQGSHEQTNSRPIISRCIFERNAGYAGGGLCSSWSDPDNPWMGEHPVNPVLQQCTFQFNRAYIWGGAFFANSPSVPGDTLEIKDCAFTDNYVYLYGGGGLYFNQTANTHVRLSGCLMERDSAPLGALGGAIHFALSADFTEASLVLDSCVFRRNIAADGAGLYYTGDIGFFDDVDFFFRANHCLFEGNKTTNGGSGSAYTIGSARGGGDVRTEVTNCIFKDNLAGNFTTTVGGFAEGKSKNLIQACVFLGNQDVDFPNELCLAVQCGASGASNATREVHTEIKNCLFAHNGGGVAALVGENNLSTTEITNCTFFDNNEYIFVKSKVPSSPGGGYNEMYLNNCVVWEKETDGIRMFYNNNPAVYEMYGFHAENTIITVPDGFWQWPGAQGVFGDHVIFNEYPEFEDTLAFDFRLQPCSPAVNAGSNVVADTFGLLTDLDGHPRILQDTVDLGAYETPIPCINSSEEAPRDLFSFVLSPNPASDNLVITISPALQGRALLMDLRGVLIKEAPLQEGSALLDVTALPNGMYLVELLNEKGRVVATGKVVVQHE
ncbi:MAG: choice-of-anchor Q domain-containing protein, partial [Saprospiraceae bacterium]|nr:choice-of-anchor Q domain-containing protein [Saprospiraceae bacterium]